MRIQNLDFQPDYQFGASVNADILSELGQGEPAAEFQTAGCPYAI